MFDESEIKRKTPILFTLTTCGAHICVCVCVCGDGSFCTHIDVQCANDRHALQFFAGWCFFYVCRIAFSTDLFFSLFVDTKHCIVPWNNEWALHKCNTFKDCARLKMTIDRQSIRSMHDALALEIVSSHVCAC